MIQNSPEDGSDYMEDYNDYIEDDSDYMEDDDDDEDVIYGNINPGSETLDDIDDQQDQGMDGYTRNVVYNQDDMRPREIETEYEYVRFNRNVNRTALLTHAGTWFEIERHLGGGFICSAHPLIHLTRTPQSGFIREGNFHIDMNNGIY